MRTNPVIYILTNPSFPQFVKIGYSDDVESRVRTLNNNPGLPYSFRIYATYEVTERLDDLKLRKIIDTLNPTLRCQEQLKNGKTRTREFFAMTAEDAYTISEAMAEISGTTQRLHKWEATANQKAEEENAEEIRELDGFRHYFKGVTFSSSLTGKTYDSKSKEPNGALGIYDHETGEEIENYSAPSKKQIVRIAIADLGLEVDNSKTLYQLMHILENHLLKK